MIWKHQKILIWSKEKNIKILIFLNIFKMKKYKLLIRFKKNLKYFSY